METVISPAQGNLNGQNLATTVGVPAVYPPGALGIAAKKEGKEGSAYRENVVLRGAQDLKMMGLISARPR